MIIFRLMVVVALLAIPAICAFAADAKRGEYLVQLGGCLGCHTEDRKGAPSFAGGRALKTPFGVFYGPNITSDPQAGIGRWSEANFVRAMREGIRPDGADYFPAFPYPSFTKITDTDLRDIWAYLRTIPPNPRPNQPHQLRFPYGWRYAVKFWKALYFTPGEMPAVTAAGTAVARGAYLVHALSHCGECHTPRNFLGGPMRDRLLAGGIGHDGKRVPNLTPARLDNWTVADFRKFFADGITPDDDTVAEAMDEVIRNTTSRMTPQDADAMIAYLRSLPPIADKKP